MNLLKKLTGFALLTVWGLALAAPSQAISVLIKKSATSPGIPTLLTDSSTGQVGQTGQVTAAVVTVELPGTTSYVASSGTYTETGNGTYDYFPAASETGSTGVLKIHVTCTGCQTVDTTAQIVGFDPSSGTNLGLSNLPGVVAAQSGDAYARLGTPAGASTSADIAAVRAALGTGQTGDLFALLNPLVSASKFTASALSLAPAGGGGGSVTDSTVQADVIAALVAQGYTVTRAGKLDNLDATISGVSARLMAYSLAGTTFGDIAVNTAAVTYGNSSPTYSGLLQTSPFSLNGTNYVTSTITKNSSGAITGRTATLANQ